jgi:aspartyl-tRNA(Asn)/glutamyl-tRNA(Gln) amidotransferase subunit A
VDLHKLTISELRKLLRKGDVTPLEVAEDLVRVVDSRNPSLCAYLDFYADELLEESRSLTDGGSWRDLTLGGVPVAVKDNICIEGRRTTCGSRILDDYRSLFTAPAVERLREAGALVSGKTNCDEFAMGSSNEHSAFGPVANPWDASRVPGGSSGGSAAAVAAGMAYAALGTDTGGSIRQPAGFCGVVGVKPTYGRVSRYGLVAFASSFDQIGPLARSVEDAALLLGAMCGMDARDSTSLSHPVPDLVAGLEHGLEGLTVGVPGGFLREGLDREVEANFHDVVRRLEGSGVAVHDVDLPHADYAVAAYYVIANAEASANLARYDGVKYGRRSRDAGDLHRMYINTRGEGFGEEVKRRILLGTYVLSEGYFDAYYLQAQKVRSLIIRDFRAAFDACDLLLLPTSPTPAFAAGERINDPVVMYMSDVFTVPANLAGLPAVSVPSGLTGGRLPLGVQLIGPALGEEKLLRGARGIERLVDFKERAFA